MLEYAVLALASLAVGTVIFVIARAVWRNVVKNEKKREEMHDSHYKCIVNHCETVAEYRMPVIRTVRSWKDSILRSMGATYRDRFYVEVMPSFSAPVELCLRHQEWFRSLREREIAKANFEYADFVNKQREALYNHELHEAVVEVNAKMTQYVTGAAKALPSTSHDRAGGTRASAWGSGLALSEMEHTNSQLQLPESNHETNGKSRLSLAAPDPQDDQ